VSQMRLNSFTVTTVYLALLGVASQVLGDPVSMAVALSLTIATVALAMKAEDKGEPSYIALSLALNFLFLPLLLYKLSESPLIRAALFIPASLLQLETFLRSPRSTPPIRPAGRDESYSSMEIRKRTEKIRKRLEETS